MSFTLTIIVVAVLLLTAALTLLTIFGSGISGITNLFSYSEEAQIEAQCADVAREVQENICDRYSSGGPGDVFASQTSQASETCNDIGCNVGNAVNQNGVIQYSYSSGGNTESLTIDTTVEIDGKTVNCFEDENGIEQNVCPIS